MKIAAAYIRVSTDSQVELSPDSQIKLIRDYAKKNDMVVPDEYIFRDDGISGRSTQKRPAFNKMIGTAKQKPKPFDVILLWKFSRFARNREDSIVYKSMLRKQCGIDVISISENVGDDKMSILIEAMIEAMDEYYSINLAEEVKRGMQEKFSRGQIVSAPPIGYKAINGQFVPDENAIVVKEIFEEFTNGKGTLTIAKQLNERGILTKTGNLFENRSIEYILRNPVYIGKLRKSTDGKGSRNNFRNSQTEIVNGTHEPIISEETFNTAQKILDENKAKYARYARTAQRKRAFLLQGLVHCSNCGATLTISQLRTNPSLQCYRYTHGKCNVSHSITEEKLNKAVIDELNAFLKKKNFDIDINFKTIQKNRIDNAYLIRREQEKLQRVKQAYEAGIDTLEEYRENKRAILSRIEELEAQSNPISKRQAIKELHKKILDALKIIASNDINVETKNSTLRGFIDRIIFTRSTGSVDVFYYL